MCAGAHSNESHEYTIFKAIVSDVWGIGLALGNMALLLQFLVALWNLAMPVSDAMGKGACLFACLPY